MSWTKTPNLGTLAERSGEVVKTLLRIQSMNKLISLQRLVQAHARVSKERLRDVAKPQP